MAEKYNPKSKEFPTSWKALQRKLPRSLSSFQIIILAGFLSLLIMRSTIGIASVNFAGQYTTSADDEYAREEQSRLADSNDVEPKRNLVQTADFDTNEKVQYTGRKKPDVEFEEEMDQQVADHHLAEVRVATGSDEKKDEKPRKATEKKNPVLPKPKEEVVEDFEHVEAQLGEEETTEEEPADFDVNEKLQYTGRKKSDVEFEEEMDRQVADHHLAEVRAATVKDVKKDEQPRNATEKKKPVLPNPEEEVVEDFEHVEAELGEEETAEEHAEFQKFEKVEKGKVVSSTKQPTEVADSKENSVEKTTEKEPSAEEKAEEVRSKQEKSAEGKKSEEDESVNAKEADNGKDIAQENIEEAKAEEEMVQDSEPEKPPKLTPEEVKALSEEAMANMRKAIRRDDPNAFTLGPKISDWDEQRAAWLEKNPDMKSTDPHKPKVLLLSGSQPWPCNSPVGDHYLLKMIKNKVDYARIHKIETFYNFAHLDKPMSHFWAKLPLIRKMMLMRPEVEWIFWMDSDAMFTDMVFEIPFERYQEHNLVMWGYPVGVYDERSWVACNTGAVFLRNNQWTLDLLEIWSHMGPEGEIRIEAGKIMTSYLTQRSEMGADDQSALVFLLLTMPELRPKTALESEYQLSGYWVDVVDRYEEFLEKSRPGAGGYNWPFVTHFTGCQPCSGHSNELYEGNKCLDNMERAFNFADNQVLRPFGFEHENLQGSKVVRIRNETTKPIRSVPVDNPWAVESFYS